MEKLQVVRTVLESVYNEVVFIKSLSEQTSVWEIGNNHLLQISVNDKDVTIRTNTGAFIPNDLAFTIENKLIELGTQNQKMEEGNEMVEMEEMKTLKNGVQFFPLMVEEDFEEAQRILDSSYVTDMIDAESAYNERVHFEGLGSYKVKVERKEDYERFSSKLRREKNHFINEMIRKKSKLNDFYRKGLLTYDETILKMDEISAVIDKGCSCKLCSFELSFEEWKSGKMSNGAKVGKSLRKVGFSQEIIDFYSLQTKEEKELFFTITDTPQHVVGMSYYSDMTWNQYNKSSCQDPKHDYEDCIMLAGSLNDNKLFIGFLHDSMEDLEDMDEKALARTILRYVTIDDKPCLVSTTYYGNNDSMDAMNQVIEKLGEMEVYPKEYRTGDFITESANGFYTLSTWDEVHICEEREEEVEVECPMCSGSGRYEVEINYRDHSVDCPACSGSGELTSYVYIDVNEYVEVEHEQNIEPYVEGYTHYGSYINMQVDLERVREEREKRTHVTCERVNE